MELFLGLYLDQKDILKETGHRNWKIRIFILLFNRKKITFCLEISLISSLTLSYYAQRLWILYAVLRIATYKIHSKPCILQNSFPFRQNIGPKQSSHNVPPSSDQSPDQSILSFLKLFLPLSTEGNTYGPRWLRTFHKTDISLWIIYEVP